MSIIATVDPSFNFWELYPELGHIEEFKLIKDNFKKQSSSVMWLVYFTYDLESKFRNVEFDERVKILSKDILKDESFFRNNKIVIESAGLMWIKLNDTAAKRHLRQWYETIEKRTAFLREVDYDLDNYDKLDKMATSTPNLFKAFEEIQKQIAKEDGGSITKGGYEPSLADSGEI